MIAMVVLIMVIAVIMIVVSIMVRIKKSVITKVIAVIMMTEILKLSPTWKGFWRGGSFLAVLGDL